MRSLLLAIASIGLVGCVGELDTTGGGTAGGGTTGGGGGGSGSGTSMEAKRLFDTNVYPTIKAKCAGCHDAANPINNLSGFVAGDVSTGHTTILGFTSVVGSFAPTAAPILLKIAGGHQGLQFTPDENTKITEWLDQEVIEHNGGTMTTTTTTTTETPAAATQRVMAAWSACMTKTNFDAADMADAWGNMTANNNQRCSNCHANGDGGFMATVDSQLMFDVTSSNKYYMLQYFRVKLDLANLANSTIEINKDSFMGVSQGMSPHLEHPRFNATTNNGMTALQSYYDTTKAAMMAAGTAGCGASKLTN